MIIEFLLGLLITIGCIILAIIVILIGIFFIVILEYYLRKLLPKWFNILLISLSLTITSCAVLPYEVKNTYWKTDKSFHKKQNNEIKLCKIIK